MLLVDFDDMAGSKVWVMMSPASTMIRYRRAVSLPRRRWECIGIQ